jgi:ribosomal protein L30E
MNSKLTLVIKSGKYRLGKILSFESNNNLWVKDIHLQSSPWDKARPNSSWFQTTAPPSEELNSSTTPCSPSHKCITSMETTLSSVSFLIIKIRETVINSHPLSLKMASLKNLVSIGTACGRLHRVAVMAITDAGDSDILESVWETPAHSLIISLMITAANGPSLACMQVSRVDLN